MLKVLRSLIRSAVCSAAVLSSALPCLAEGQETTVLPREFRVVPSESGPTSYYEVVSNGPEPFIHAAYEPPLATVVLGYSLPEAKRRAVSSIAWKWRALTLPEGGNECRDGKGDSAAVVYVTWRQTLRWYTVKYVWSAVGPRGKTCDRKSNPFRAQDTVVVDSGGPVGEWRTVRIDPDKEFRRHFAGGDESASVPDLLGVAIMTDGDQTRSSSAADYAGFTIGWK
jgi:hypothetical protein